MAAVVLESVSKRYAGVGGVEVVSFRLETGEFLTLLGPSGCGKSTTLRLVAGLIEPDEGRILIGDADVTHVPTHRRRIGMVFQNLALFPHMTAAENIAFGLRMQGRPAAEQGRLVGEALEMVQLTGLGQRLPKQLSGGQQQRVALARALVTRPAVLLLDEPFAALDRKLRLEMQSELRELTRNIGMTAIFVTHDQEEALVMSDRIAVMQGGRIAQIETPQAVFERPSNAFVADFMGATNLFLGRVAATTPDGTRLRLEGFDSEIVVAADGVPGAAVDVAIRPEAIRLSVEEPQAAPNSIAGVVATAVYEGTTWTYRIQPNGARPLITVRLGGDGNSPTGRFGVGQAVWLWWPVTAAHLMARA